MLAVFAVEVVAGGERRLPTRVRPFRGCGLTVADAGGFCRGGGCWGRTSLADEGAPIPGMSPDLKGLGEEVRDERRKTGDVPGSRFSVPGSWFLVLGSRFSVPGSWFLVLGSQFSVLSSRFSVLSSQSSVLSPQFLRGTTSASPPSRMMNTVSFEGRVMIKPR